MYDKVVCVCVWEGGEREISLYKALANSHGTISPPPKNKRHLFLHSAKKKQRPWQPRNLEPKKNLLLFLLLSAFIINIYICICVCVCVCKYVQK